MDKVVFDCNVFLQAIARKNGPAGACLRLVEEGYVKLYLSSDILSELIDVLNRPIIKRKFPEMTNEIIEEFLERLKSKVAVVERVHKHFKYQRDEKDEPYINLAIEIDANCLISRDQDLLGLMTSNSDDCNEFRRLYPKLCVVNPIEFLKRVESSGK